MFWDNHKMSSQCGTQRFLMNFVPEDKRPKEVIAFNAGRLKAAFKTLDTALDGRDWLVGDRPATPIFPAAAIFSTPSPSASTARTGAISIAGCRTSNRSTAGNTPMT